MNRLAQVVTSDSADDSPDQMSQVAHASAAGKKRRDYLLVHPQENLRNEGQRHTALEAIGAR